LLAIAQGQSRISPVAFPEECVLFNRNLLPVGVTYFHSSTVQVQGGGFPSISILSPTDGPGDNFPSTAPVGPYGTNLAIFNGTSPNGVWSLYVVDDAWGDVGSISGGWRLDLTTAGIINPLPALLTLAILTTNRQCQFTLQGRAGDRYVTEGSFDLINWTPIGTNTLFTDSLLFTDPSSATNALCRFYRALWRP
jgi:hypothetical protein